MKRSALSSTGAPLAKAPRDQHPSAAAAAPPASEARNTKRVPPSKVQRSFYVDAATYNRFRAALLNTRNQPGEDDSQSAVVDRLLREEVERLERTYNDGNPWPAEDAARRHRTGPR